MRCNLRTRSSSVRSTMPFGRERCHVLAPLASGCPSAGHAASRGSRRLTGSLRVRCNQRVNALESCVRSGQPRRISVHTERDPRRLRNPNVAAGGEQRAPRRSEMSTLAGTQPQPATTPERRPAGRAVLMCRPEHFTVVYRINPWMNPAMPTDTNLALAQWQALHDTYVGLGYDVQLIDPIEGLPDMVYAANGGFVLDGIACGAKFTHPERQPEGPAYMQWFGSAGFDVHSPVEV